MSQWLEGALARAEKVEDWLSPQRQASLLRLRDTPWPSRKTEAWKYTPLTALERSELASDEVQGAEGQSKAQRGDTATAPAIEGLNSIDLIVEDGAFREDLLPRDLPAGLSITALRSASGAQQEKIRELFGAVKPERHIFGLVNDVLALDGLMIEVAAEAKIERPIRIVHTVSKSAEAHSRLLVHLASGAQATFVEQVLGEGESFNTSVSEYVLDEHARAEHYRFALQTGTAMAVGGCHFRLGDHSELFSNIVGFGSDLSRLDTDIIHAGQHALAKLNAIYLLKDSELFDLHSTVEHAVPCGTTEENVRGIVSDRGRAVFNGRIHIHPQAQKTVAQLNNRNLLLSNKATANTKPELEIYADDVRCAHGATIAQMDKAALYYLQTRGISRSQAQVMLNFGFINELVEQMPNAALAEWLREGLRQRFAAMRVE